MKRKVVYLFVSGMLAAFILNGCGNKSADDRVEDVMSGIGLAVENGDEDAAMAAWKDLDKAMPEEDESDFGDVCP